MAINKQKKTRAKIGIGVSTNWKKGLYDNKITITNGYKNGWYTSSKTSLKYYYQSAWEKDIFCLLDNKKELKWKRHKGAIIYNGCKRYYPDIDVENTKKKFIIEIKGRLDEKQEILDKLNAALVYCKENKAKYLFVVKNNNSFVIISNNKIESYLKMSYYERKNFLQKCKNLEMEWS